MLGCAHDVGGGVPVMSRAVDESLYRRHYREGVWRVTQFDLGPFEILRVYDRADAFFALLGRADGCRTGGFLRFWVIR